MLIVGLPKLRVQATIYSTHTFFCSLTLMGASPRALDTVIEHAPMVWPELGNQFRIRNRNEVERGNNGRILVGGREAIVHIQDTWHSREMLTARPEDSKKFHLFHCQTLEQMLSSGRFERYVATDRTDGLFTVHSREADNTSHTLDARLAVCKNCMSRTDHTGSRETFDLNAFLAHSDRAPREGPMPSTRDTDGRSSGYTSNWPTLSAKTRERAGWQCSKCKVHLQAHPALLHVHHVNGVKSDNTPSNLAVLCVLCHRDEPSHSHIAVTVDNERIIREARLVRHHGE